MRALVAIAHYGSKNRRHLERMLAEFRKMDLEVTVVVLSEAPKDVPGDVEMLVGLPSTNPWSLPFAHRPLFRDRCNDFDLFIYAEDDTLIEKRHIDAFLRLSKILPENYLPGFTRYEESPDGRRSMAEVHSYYRWDPTSVFVKSGRTFAKFTNEHAACYMLTREQLLRALDTEGYAMTPHEGAYDMLVSAATDPYTSCGFVKVLCLDDIDDLLIHHLSNANLGKFGIPEEEFRIQVKAIERMGRDSIDSTQLLEPELPPRVIHWSKHTYQQSPSKVLDLLPSRPTRILSLGCASGTTEGALVADGISVTAIPIDAIMGELASSRGVDVLPPRVPTLNEMQAIGSFDTVLALDTLGYLEDPIRILRHVGAVLRPGGVLLATAPDHRRYAVRNRVPLLPSSALPGSWTDDGFHWTDRRVLKHWLTSAGYSVVSAKHRRATRREPVGSASLTRQLMGNTVAAIATYG